MPQPRAGGLRGTSARVQERLQPRALAQWRHTHRTAAACAAERTLDSPATARFTSMHDSPYLPRSNPPRWSACLLALLLATPSFAHAGDAPGDGERERARELGVAPGIFAPGRDRKSPRLNSSH